MCGIVGFIGNEPVYDKIIKGLSRLEYRGYDSAGLAVLEDGNLVVRKCKGKVADLQSLVGEELLKATVGIGHTRWATHGVPNDVNAHPHCGENKSIALIHNGIIENYASLKEALIGRGHHFASETDTEVLV
ncbi:MAG: glutamine--fructose-6-phosphate aminotransferase, partial [Bacteroidota bacterium]